MVDIGHNDSATLFSENYKSNISDLITSIQQNSHFSKLIIYSLNTLKSHLVLPTPIMALNNAVLILKCKIISNRFFK